MPRVSARALLPLTAMATYACAFDWDGLDPRASSGTAGAGPGTSVGGDGGVGGAPGTGGDGGTVNDCDPASCPQPTGECEAATCVGGVCGIGPAPDGTACTEDGVFCNGAEVCSAGACVSPGDPCPVGDADDDCSEACDETTDSCTGIEPKDTPCDDGLFCNGMDLCNPQGSCTQHVDPPCPTGDDDCDGGCNEDLDDCSDPEPPGSVCNDGAYCNGFDYCVGGSCSGHTGNPCPGADGDSDCSETCNESADACTANDPNGTDCNGIVDNICCSSGQCTTSSSC